MTARLLDGRSLAESYKARIAERVAAVKARGGNVRLDAVLVGSSDNGARVYATNQGRTCAAVGIDYKLHELDDGNEPAGYDEIAGRVLLLNTRENVTAVMLHMPLPTGVDAYSIQSLIAPQKDVEGVNPANIGNIVYGRSSLAPCTALAVIKMLEATGAPLRGKRALVIGASDVVGKPIAVLLMRTDASVTTVNKWTDPAAVAALARESDVIVVAAGVPGLLKATMVRAGSIVVDVGVNRVAGPDGKTHTVGDVDFEPVRVALGPDGWISPVPGGVGPMTVSMLLLNVVQAAERAVGIA